MPHNITQCSDTLTSLAKKVLMSLRHVPSLSSNTCLEFISWGYRPGTEPGFLLLGYKYYNCVCPESPRLVTYQRRVSFLKRVHTEGQAFMNRNTGDRGLGMELKLRN
jgi:hypothetical protein